MCIDAKAGGTGYFRPECQNLPGTSEVVMDENHAKLESYDSIGNVESSFVMVTELSASWTNRDKMVLKGITFNLDHVSFLFHGVVFFRAKTTL